MKIIQRRMLSIFFIIAGLGGLAAVGYYFSGTSGANHRLLLGFSGNRLILALALFTAAGISLCLSFFSWREPEKFDLWFEKNLGRDGWLYYSLAYCCGVFVLAGIVLSLSTLGSGSWSIVFYRLLPMLLWLMLVAVLTLVFLLQPHPVQGGLKKEGDHEPAPSIKPVGVADRNASFQRQSVLGFFIVLLSICTLVIINQVLGYFVIDHLDPNIVSLVRPSMAGDFHPEQLERTRYIVSTVLFPVLCFILWIIAGKMRGRIPKTTRLTAAILFMALAGGLAYWLYSSLKTVDFYYLKVLYPTLDIRPALAFFVVFLVIYGLEQAYATRVWLKWGLRIVTAVLGLYFGMVILSACFSVRGDPYALSKDFNAYYYSIVQVFFGKTLLVDLTNQYGFYPYFLQPIFKWIGMDVPQLTLVMGVLLLSFYLIIYFLLIKLIKSRLIAICGFIAVVGTWMGSLFNISFDPYFQYWPQRVLFPGLLLLLVYLYQKANGKIKTVLYYFTFLTCGIGLLWNLDTGTVTFAAWVIYLYWEVLNQVPATGFRKSALRIMLHTIRAAAMVVLAFGSLLLYTGLRSGVFPDPRQLIFYQSVFYQDGYYMLPMPLFHPWNLVILTYMVGICLSAASLVNHLRGTSPRKDSASSTWINMVFLVSVLGAGLFTYYQGRSVTPNLQAVFWSVFFLAALFADALFSRILAGLRAISPKKISSYAMLPLPVFLLLVLFLYSPAVFNLTPSVLGRVQSQLPALLDPQQNEPNYYIVSTALMRRNFPPGEAAPVFSIEYETLFYLTMKTANPVKAPGWMEEFLQSDIQKYYDYFKAHGGSDILISDDFKIIDPDLFAYIHKNFTELDRVGDLYVFRIQNPNP